MRHVVIISEKEAREIIGRHFGVEPERVTIGGCGSTSIELGEYYVNSEVVVKGDE